MGGMVQRADDQVVSNPAALFISNELLPMLASFFPKSAAQINNNLSGHAITYGMMLKGFPAGVVRTAVCQLAEHDPDGFAPIPQKLKSLCEAAMGNDAPEPVKTVSIRALEMRAEHKALIGEIGDKEIAAYVQKLARNLEGQGFVITGRVF